MLDLSKFFRTEIMKIMQCMKCGSLNITYELDSGKTICNDCHFDGGIKKIDHEDYRNKNIEEETDKLNQMQIMGARIKIDPNALKLNDINDFSRLGL